MENEQEIRKVKALSVSNLLRKKYSLLPFTGPWFDAFSEPAAYGAWLIYGGSSNGKTSFVQQLVKYFDEELNKRVAYYSIEEMSDHTMQQGAKRAEWRETGSRIKILDELYTPAEIDQWLSGHKKPDVIIIDSVQHWSKLHGFTFKQYKELKAKHPRKLFIYTSHADRIGPKGALANDIMFDAALKIYVEGYRAFSKGRYIGTSEYYSIWPEKELEIW